MSYIDTTGNWDFRADFLYQIADFSAAFGDTITFGGTRWFREKVTSCRTVDYDSDRYFAGSFARNLYVGTVAGVITGGIGSAIVSRVGSTAVGQAIARGVSRTSISLAQKITKIPGLSGYFERMATLRQAYLSEVAGVEGRVAALRAEGVAEEAIAREANALRLALETTYKNAMDPVSRYALFVRNRLITRYDTRYGPTYQWLKGKGYSDGQIIKGAYGKTNSLVNRILGVR